jgi:two-component system chemotaxis response regulator CheY
MPQNTHARVQGTSCRILVAEADAQTRSTYSDAFQRTGCDVVEASDGRDALTKALVREPSAVVTDLRLPLLDGYTLCDILRRDHLTTNVPIVVTTEETQQSEHDRARDAGADLVLVKPVLPEVLLRAVEELMGDAGHPRQRLPRRSADGTTAATSGQSSGKSKSKAHARFVTASPATPAPRLTCPSCDAALKYEQSQIGGVNDAHDERWDYFSCTRCGVFQYRHRTRKVRHLSHDEARWLKR